MTLGRRRPWSLLHKPDRQRQGEITLVQSPPSGSIHSDSKGRSNDCADIILPLVIELNCHSVVELLQFIRFLPPKATKQLLLLQNRSTLCAGHACFFRAELNQLSMSTVCVGIALRHFEARPTKLSVSTANEFTSCIHLFIRNYLS